MKTFKNQNQGQKSQPNQEKITSALSEHEEELFEKVKNDIKLRDQHKVMLTSTPGYEHISEQTAEDMVDSLFRFAAFLYDLVTSTGNTSLT